MIINMPLEKPYNILLGIHHFEESIKPFLIEKNINRLFIITDATVYEIYHELVKRALSNIDLFFVVVKPGEQSKSFETFQTVTEELIGQGIKRSDYLMVLGGGVVGDLGGFVASSLYRGIKYIQVPTTLLSMVDSSIGGKTGINTKMGKNLVGAFYQPELVIIDLAFLDTLNNHEYVNGMAEVIKSGIIGDPSLFNDLLDNKIDIIQVISKAINVKKKLVLKDPYDRKERIYLNFGHTFGHAYENETNYQISHGFAVAEGMIIALKIGIKLGLTEQSILDDTMNIFKHFSLGNFGANPKALYEKIFYDKKASKDSIEMVFVTQIGSPVTRKLNKEELYECLD